VAQSAGEDFLARSWDTVASGFYGIDTATLAGTGAGSLSNAAQSMRPTGANGPFAEIESQRAILELGGIAGSLYMLMRYGLAAALLAAGIRRIRTRDDQTPLLLWSYSAVLLCMGLLSSNGSVMGLGWILIGLNLASLAEPQPSARQAPPPPDGWQAAPRLAPPLAPAG
jgi:hypothetical protein